MQLNGALTSTLCCKGPTSVISPHRTGSPSPLIPFATLCPHLSAPLWDTVGQTHVQSCRQSLTNATDNGIDTSPLQGSWQPQSLEGFASGRRRGPCPTAPSRSTPDARRTHWGEDVVPPWLFERCREGVLLLLKGGSQLLIQDLMPQPF